jgi:hypothetical protein
MSTLTHELPALADRPNAVCHHWPGNRTAEMLTPSPGRGFWGSGSELVVAVVVVAGADEAKAKTPPSEATSQ